MIKPLFSIVFTLTVLVGNAQETPKDSTSLWTRKGNISLLFN